MNRSAVGLPDLAQARLLEGAKVNIAEATGSPLDHLRGWGQRPSLEDWGQLGVTTVGVPGRASALALGRGGAADAKADVALRMDRIFIGVKTSSREKYRQRLEGALATWLRFFTRPVLLSDTADGAYSDALRQRLGGHAYLDTSCPADHNKLCCKMEVMLRMMKERADEHDWFCSADDDEYVNP